MSRGARLALLVLLVLAAAATVFGLVRLWPSGETTVAGDTAFAAPGVTFPHARVTATATGCGGASGAAGDAAADRSCGQIEAVVTSGEASGEHITLTVPAQVAGSGLARGDSIQVMRVPPSDNGPGVYQFFAVDRASGLGWLFLAFVLVVAAVARLRGLLAIVGLGIAAVVITRFMLPALLDGRSGIAVATVGASAIMFVVLYLAHGLSTRTSTALAGTLAGIALTAALAHYVVGANRLSGFDETAQFLASLQPSLDFQGLLSAAIILAGLGVLNDVTITQSSAVWELRAAGPDLPRRSLFTRAMRIGRDHIASTIYTIVFAYAGASMTVLLLLRIYDRPLLQVLATEEIATEVVRTLATAIGLVLAVPITTAIAAAMVPPHVTTPDPTPSPDEPAKPWF
ncbi:MAG: YibE/F family protein [Nocardioidaceae bacterium]|nr:YibE/F family protein [Nocardioidaceae bacterium]